MSKPVSITYLEVSPRMTGKTTRLCSMANAVAAGGRQVVFVCDPHLANWLPVPLANVNVVPDGAPSLSDGTYQHAVWFFDEFEQLKSVQLRPGAYYATTAQRLRVAGEDSPENDLLMRLIQANGQRFERYQWPFDYRDFVRSNRASMSPEQFRLSILGEFLQ
ncbi:hypothetical protein BK647_17985 [Pseudomonas protegens]|uniref:hypothetical protein n=1 Tax=Pseudomonas protegens TaxID=380021 RepID=UPI000FF24899|nr:hypothetical protein [Pseudomonas protegens]ROM40640.1 hypothetical protein BK647_17985 [Pseudomonas protegens]